MEEVSGRAPQTVWERWKEEKYLDLKGIKPFSPVTTPSVVALFNYGPEVTILATIEALLLAHNRLIYKCK
jgi:hypothetical protein